ncbi:hypothetical protein GBAR_LOCUS12461 [Geodia barretti]|nr:hypothetical protein GBAR_LOCUS12461 [Geodia barretti]
MTNPQGGFVVSDTVSLTVVPVIVIDQQPPKSLQRYKDEPISLQCRASSKRGPVTYQWFRNKKPIYRATESVFCTKSSGRFYCQVGLRDHPEQLPMLSSTTRVSINTIKITAQPQDVDGKIGECVSLQCQAEFSPPLPSKEKIEYMWLMSSTKDGKKEPLQKALQPQQSEGTLLFEQLNINHRGYYVCQACFENEFVESVEVHLSVTMAGGITKRASETSFVYTGKEDSLILKEVGISLFFPVAHCEKEIRFSVNVVNGDYVLPSKYQNMPLVSAMYKITASAKLPAPVTIRTDHCAALNKKDSLEFMVARGEPPYHFNPLPGGTFRKSYGEIKVSDFSVFTVLLNIWDWKMRFAVRVFDCNDGTTDFIVTKDIPTHCTAVREKYCRAKEIVEQTRVFSFLTTEITLMMPETPTGGWSVEPVVEPPIITMEEIHAYKGKAGTIIPNIKLNVSWKGDRPTKKDKDTVKIGVRGVKKFSFLNLPCKAFHSQSIDTFDRRNEEEVKELARRSMKDENGLNSTITEEHLLKIKEFISWKEVGPHLKYIIAGDINDIDGDFKNIADQRQRLLNLWVERNYGQDVTYLNLIMAMLEAQ